MQLLQFPDKLIANYITRQLFLQIVVVDHLFEFANYRSGQLFEIVIVDHLLSSLQIIAPNNCFANCHNVCVKEGIPGKTPFLFGMGAGYLGISCPT